MSLHKSLKPKDMLQRHRNVLTRPERIEALKELGKWEEGTSPFHLPKIAHRKAAVGKKDKADKKTDEGGGEKAPTEEAKS